MDLVFEYCYYAGILLSLIGVLWTIRTLMKGRGGRKVVLPICILLLGIALIAGPGVVSRMAVVDLGPREAIVNNERHVSLTGWDGDSYAMLADKSDAVVLQMANADVTDATLDYLAGMNKLRELDLNDSQITDAGLAKLAKLPALKTLRLRATKVTDAGFRDHLLPVATLKQIDLRQTAVSAESVQQWKELDATRRAFQ